MQTFTAVNQSGPKDFLRVEPPCVFFAGASESREKSPAQRATAETLRGNSGRICGDRPQKAPRFRDPIAQRPKQNRPIKFTCPRFPDATKTNSKIVPVRH